LIRNAPLNTGGHGTTDSGDKQPEQYLCDTCSRPLTFISAYNAWYCYPCQKYAPPRPGQQYHYPAQNQQAQGGQPAAAQAAGSSADYPQQAYSAGYEGYAAGAGGTAAEARPAGSKCPKCGAPIPASGECAHCRAKDLLAALDKKMEAASNAGVDIRKVDILIHQARNSLDEGNFGEAKATAEKASGLLEETQSHFTKAKEQLAEAGTVVGELRSKSVDVGQADSLIQLAQSFLKTGNYEKAIAYAKKAIKTANEAQTRQVTEKALEGKPALPPAVAKPVDAGPVAEAREAGLQPTKPVILAPGEKEPMKAPAGPTSCPSCGEPVEPGWKRCPSCTSPLGPAAPAAQERAGTAKPPKGAEDGARAEGSPAAASGADAAPADRAAAPKPSTDGKDGDYAVAEREIREVETELDRVEKSGQNVAHARNLLKLAGSFLRGGSYEKATRYARKVRNVLEEKKGG